MKNHGSVLLISYLPPPVGGIATWTSTILKEAKSHSDIKIFMVDIAARWRQLHQTEIWRRVLGGGLQLLRDLYLACTIIIKEHPKALHICTPAHLAIVRDISFLLLSRLFRIKKIYHLHFGRLPELTKKKNWEWRLITLAISLADLVIVLDRKSLHTIHTLFPNKDVRLIPNCISDPNIETNAKSNVESPTIARIIYIGWVIPTKGVLELVQAALKLINIPFVLEIIGPSSPVYLKQILEVGAPLGSRFLIHGEFSHYQVMEALSQANILVLPSYTEGLPNVVLEAMALGKPVIASDVGAIAEILHIGSEQPCGIVIPPKDIDALANAIQILLENESLQNKMGMNGRKRFIENFSPEKTMRELKKIWL